MNRDTRALSLIVCGAGPASAIGTMTALALGAGWDVQLVATPSALAFFDDAEMQRLTGNPVKSEYSPPGAPRSRIPDAVVVAPATYNTINKWALGISDTYALGVLAELTGIGVPVTVLPFVNTALSSRAPYQRSVESLRAEGVKILGETDGLASHAPRTGAALISSFPWRLALNDAELRLSRTVADLGLVACSLCWLSLCRRRCS